MVIWSHCIVAKRMGPHCPTAAYTHKFSSPNNCVEIFSIFIESINLNKNELAASYLSPPLSNYTLMLLNQSNRKGKSGSDENIQKENASSRLPQSIARTSISYSEMASESLTVVTRLRKCVCQIGYQE